MPLLNTDEAHDVTDAFLSRLYGEEVFERWKYLKRKLQFSCERDYATWLLELGYRATEESEMDQPEVVGGGVVQDMRGAGGGVVQDMRGAGGGVVHGVMRGAREDVKTEHITQYLQNYCNGDDGTIPRQTTTAAVDDAADFVVQKTDEFEPWSAQEMAEVSVTHEDVTYTNGPHYEVPRAKKRRSKAPPPGGTEVVAAVVDDTSKRHGCPACSYTSVHQHHMKRHYDEVHVKAKPHGCPYCDFTCSRKEHLKQHVIRKHQAKDLPTPAIAPPSESETITATLEYELQKLQESATKREAQHQPSVS